MKHQPAVIAILLLCSPALSAAQRLPDWHHDGSAGAIPREAGWIPAQDTARQTPALRPIRLAKWSLLVGGAGAGIYGFVQNARADDRFAELEQMCQELKFRCEQRTPDGAYVDEEFERLFQDVRRLDNRSHAALLVSQIGIAASVVLFLLDLGNADSPGDVPWVPPGLQVSTGRNSLALSLRVPFP